MNQILTGIRLRVERDKIIHLNRPIVNQYKFHVGSELVPEDCGVCGILDVADPSSRSITVRTQATIIHGILGFGKNRDGIIKILGGPKDIISSKQITDEIKGKILIGGAMIIADALCRAQSLGATGIVTGGIDIRNFRTLTKGMGPVGLLITEGLGSASIGVDVFDVLKEFDGKFAILEGLSKRIILPNQNPNCLIKIRATALGRENIDIVEGIAELKVGAKVRIISDSFLGLQGVVEDIDQTPTLLPSGIQSTLVTIATSNRKIREPYQNIEII